MYHTPDHSQVEIIQLVKFFLPVGPNFAWWFNSLFDNPRNFESQCYNSIIIFKRILSFKEFENI